jgi:hypothetical protein
VDLHHFNPVISEEPQERPCLADGRQLAQATDAQPKDRAVPRLQGAGKGILTIEQAQVGPDPPSVKPPDHRQQLDFGPGRTEAVD